MNAAGDVYAVILAGGNGERFWPISTPDRPKQFVEIFGGKPLIRHAADRLEGLIPPERVFVITAARLVQRTREALPQVPAENIVGEPCRRDTAAAVAVATGLVKRFGGDDAVGCILTADQLMSPEKAFRQALEDAVTVAKMTDAIVTMGITPTFPATGYGYIEEAEPVELGTRTPFRTVKRFVEKPDAKTAGDYLASGRFSWNSGQFIWRASTMIAEFAVSAPDIAPLIDAVATADDVPTLLAGAYPPLRSISLDFAVMEKARHGLVAKGAFAWDDVGSWISLPNHFPSDTSGNTRIGRTEILDVSDSVIVSDDGHMTAVMGLKDVVVVHTPTATLVCAKDRLPDMKKLVRQVIESSAVQ